ncbi:uncharacterized protein KGF55_005183 [Candida pseudojiufengensis]|uniref:uncharacterized protein n=1 Tax=Candida pseudojiufengensis TaxID=497109 RepID=UPI002224C209|nr:uncharacterized protein KGF55_005183 [Candida pseudojiufengensis]KAI5959951.1 hypothetical protein KGF55_005183 [Candida pseudojiufengensis]
MFRTSITRTLKPFTNPVLSNLIRCQSTLNSTIASNTTQPTLINQNSNNNQSISQNITNSITTLKLSSNGSRDLYAIFRLYNMPYLVTKGDKIYLPFKLKNVKIGDILKLNDVITLGSTSYTFNDKKGIDPSLFELQASVVEITREPLYHVIRKKQRCRRTKTFNVEPFQTVLMINELKLK